ncbi:MAG: ubiquinone/menaquinone biosynthesis methyltransferase [Chloroflexi bacterium]|nr:ubiquinone/menaquinone biosynthesis methyltransferase [Chloroflexota bacterium]
MKSNPALPALESPAADPQKEARVRRMFAGIARRYDLLNTVLTASRDRHWRRFAADAARLRADDTALDVCTGTGEIALELARRVGPSGRVVALDFCEDMLAVARGKLGAVACEGYVELVLGNAEGLPFPDDSFVATTNGFALRNVASIERTLCEMRRVTWPGGKVVALEIAKPQMPIIRHLYRPYFYGLVPIFGRLISGDTGAYRYLPDSLTRFPSRKGILDLFTAVGLRNPRCHDLTLGIATVFVGTK